MIKMRDFKFLIIVWVIWLIMIITQLETIRYNNHLEEWKPKIGCGFIIKCLLK